MCTHAKHALTEKTFTDARERRSRAKRHVGSRAEEVNQSQGRMPRAEAVLKPF